MNNNNQLKAGVILTYVELIVQYIVSFIYLPFLIRFLGQSEYGLYNYVASVVTYLNILKAGMSSAYVRFYTKARKEDNSEESVKRVNGTFMIVNAMISAIAIIVGAIIFIKSDTIFGGTLSQTQLAECKPIVVVLVLNVVLSFMMSIFSSNIVAHEKYVFQKILTLVEVILQPCVILPVVYFGAGALGYSIATLVVLFIIDIANIVFCKSKLEFALTFKGVNLIAIKEIFSFTSFLVISYVVDQINWSVDKFLLGKMASVIAVSVYQVAAQLKTYASKMVVAVSNVFTVRVNKLVFGGANNSQLTDLMIKVGRIQFCILVLICTGFGLFGQKFLNLWVGSDYADAYYITLLLLIPTIIPSMQKIGFEILKAKNMHKVRSLVYLAIAIVNIGISIPLCKLYGGIGCAMGTAFSVIVGNGIFMNLYYWKAVRLEIPRFWLNIFKMLPAIIAALIIGILGVVLFGEVSFTIYLIEILLYCVIYFACMWFIGFNKFEKELVVDIFKRVKSFGLKRS